MSELVERARRFATRAHTGQQRKYEGGAYIAHPARVARAVHNAGGDEAQVAAAWLHDVVEDTPVTHEDVEHEFGPDVAQLVFELTNIYRTESHPHLNRAERKTLEVERLRNVSKRAKLVKLFDVMDNLPSIVAHDPGFARVFVPESQALLAAITQED